MSRRIIAVAILLGFACAGHARAEAILEYFNTSWNEIATRMPEVAEAGYTALWLPPPFIAGEPTSVGYDTYNRFDFGTSAATRYGTASDLLNVVKVAHQFGIRVYFDNVSNQNGGALPDTAPGTLSTTQPGFVPEDFHLIQLTTNTYSSLNSSNENYNDEWQDLNLNAFGLDIAQESPNASFGAAERDTYPKFVGIRQPNNPELYPDTNVIAATDGQGFVFHPFDGNGQPVAEDVNGLLIRAVRWFIDQSKCDGFRLDDAKGVPSYFFGDQGYTDSTKDTSTSGYAGGIQAQFNITHGYNSWSNLRATLFSDQSPRKNAMIWGEVLGQPTNCTVTCQQNYVDAGMRVDNNEFYGQMFNAVCGECSGGLWNLDQDGAYAFDGDETSLIHAGTQDYNAISIYDRPSAYSLLLTRGGLPSVYTDGYNEEQTTQSDGAYFPAIGNNAFLGEFTNSSPAPYLPNLCYINQLFARGNQNPKWSDQTYCAYERLDFRENSNMSTSSAAVLLYMLAQNGSGGESRGYATSFPVGARLINYSTYNNAFGFGATVATNGFLLNDSGSQIIAPAGGYFAFSWSVPVMPAVWNDGIYDPVQPITILQNGQQAGTMTYYRHDGRNGDPNFNPYGVTNAVSGSYQYPMTVPRITSPSNLTFIARADGSTANMLIKLDGGIDLNSQMGLGPQSGELRDNPPGVADDVFLGYEQMAFVQRVAEKFAARDISRNIIGSPGCETYQATIGTAGFTVNNGIGTNTSVGTVTWAYHDPTASNQLASATLQFTPAPQNAAGQPVTVWVKIGYTNQPQYAVLYYTTDGATYPDGSAGLGKGTTQVAPMAFNTNGTPDGSGTPVWWTATLPALPTGTVLRYKIGVYRTDANPWFPLHTADVAMKQRMETIYQITNFNAATASFYPHNDYGVTQTGLDEGFHVLRTKTFLQRTGQASIYNLNVQTFYYDTRTPQGQIMFPANYSTITGTNYGVVVRADRTTSAVWYRITDGNGTGQWTPAVTNWPSTVGLNTVYPLEWRFNYANIPTNGMAQIQARLLRLTSSTNMNLTDVAGHYTTLSATVNTGPLVDGIPSTWRAQYFPTVDPTGQTTNYLSCATCDADGTGQDNLFKYSAGLNPTNPSSIFAINSTQSVVPGGFVVNWNSVPGYVYEVSYGPTVSGPWQSIGGPSTAAVNQVSMTYTDTTASAASIRFYHVQNLGQ
jgi:alpha amylase-like protein